MGKIEDLKNGCLKARDALILEHMNLALRLAGSYWFNNKRRMDDIRSVALLGLVEAVEWASVNLEDDNLGAVVNVTVRRHINDYILYDQTIRCPKSESNKPIILSATCHDDDGNPYEDFTLTYTLFADVEQVATFKEFYERMGLDYKQRGMLEMKIKGHTLAEIAKVFCCTAPWVCQILQKIGEKYLKLQSSDERG